MDDSVAPMDITDGRDLDDALDWTWPPYAPLEPAGGTRFTTEDRAPSSTVQRPLIRLGRWTLLYRRAA